MGMVPPVKSNRRLLSLFNIEHIIRVDSADRLIKMGRDESKDKKEIEIS